MRNKKLKRVNGKNYIRSAIYLLSLLFFSQMSAQTFTVDGTISVATTTVQNASVTFIDMSDTTKKFSALTDSSGKYQVDIITSLHHSRNNLPTKFELDQNYPNPFSTTTSIPYKLNQQADVQVTIYDVVGRTVRKFTVTEQAVGKHNIIWDGVNSFGQRSAAGIYFYQFKVAGENRIKKMILCAGVDNDIGPVHTTTYSSLLKYESEMHTILGGNYGVRIENSSDTFPMIIPETRDNQEVQGNTTLNFAVSSFYPIANSDIDLDDTEQVIRGFGAANILPWRPDMTADEIEKAFASAASQSTDGGLSKRMFGTLLTWMQEHEDPVFVIATANDIEALPPELLRKGRFDEIFFVGLPNPDTRKTIFEIHLNKRNRDAAKFDLDALAEASEGYSGAEIEQAVIAALHEAYANKSKLTTARIVSALKTSPPLSVTMAEKVQALLAWAKGRCVPAD